MCTTKKLIEALEQLPEDEQEKRAASYLEDLQQHGGEAKEESEDPYSALKILRDAKLPGPADASVTYEKKLYRPYSERP